MNGQAEKVAAAFGEYFIPQFVKECAARGIHFNSDEEVQAALESANLIDQCEKTAQDQGLFQEESPIIQANELLKQAAYQGLEEMNEGQDERTQAAQNILNAFQG